MYNVNVVPLDKVPQVLPVVEEYLKVSLIKSESIFGLDKVYELLLTGTWKLLIAFDADNVVHGAATLQTITTPKDTVGFITCIGGRLVSDKGTFERFKQVLKEIGITEIQGTVRPSIQRLWKRLGFTDKYTVVGVQI